MGGSVSAAFGAPCGGIPQIEVTFNIDVNGIVNVSAKDLGTGKEQNITITASSNMKAEEIDRAIRDAQQFASEDAKLKEEHMAKNKAETMVYQAEGYMKKLSKKDQEILKEPLKRTKKALRGKDGAELAEAGNELERILDSLDKSGPGTNGENTNVS